MEIDGLVLLNALYSNFKLELEQADVEDDKFFKETVTKGLDLFSLPRKDLARRFNCPFSTVDRWVAGVTSPHPKMRTAVYKFFIEKASEKLK